MSSILTSSTIPRGDRREIAVDMSETPDGKGRGNGADRLEREAAALRANLLRRKRQGRLRAEPAAETGVEQLDLPRATEPG